METGESVVHGYESLSQKKKETNKSQAARAVQQPSNKQSPCASPGLIPQKPEKKAGRKREERTEWGRGTLMNRILHRCQRQNGRSSPNSTMYYTTLNKSFPTHL